MEKSTRKRYIDNCMVQWHTILRCYNNTVISCAIEYTPVNDAGVLDDENKDGCYT